MMTSPQTAFGRIQASTFKVKDLEAMQISAHFTWADVFRNRTWAEIRQCPRSYFDNALHQSEVLESARAEIEKHLKNDAVMDVTSWYRSKAANAAVHGSNTSRHLFAAATDFVVPGFEGLAGNRKIQACLIKVMRAHGFFLEITGGDWTHIDTRVSGKPFAFNSGGYVLSAKNEADFASKWA